MLKYLISPQILPPSRTTADHLPVEFHVSGRSPRMSVNSDVSTNPETPNTLLQFLPNCLVYSLISVIKNTKKKGKGVKKQSACT